MHVHPDAATTTGGQASYVRFVVLGALCLAATVSYVQRNSIVVAEKTVRDELGLSKEQMGLVMSAFFLTYAALQIPAGALGQRWGTRRALSLYSLLWSVAAGTFALAGGFWGLACARLGQGAAQAGIFPCTTVSIGKWMPSTARAMANGTLASFMSLGGAAGAALTGLLLEQFGWRATFAFYALPGLVWAVGFYVWFRDEPWRHPAVNESELRLIRPEGDWQIEAAAPPTPEPTPWRAIFGNWAMCWICAQQFFRAAGYIFFATWFATYLQETRNVSTTMSGVMTSLPLAAVVLSGFVGGWLSDGLLRRTGDRRIARQYLSVASLLAAALLIVLAYFIHAAWAAVLIISAGSFAASLAGPCAYSITIDMGGKHTAAVFSTMNMLGNIGAIACANGVPWFVNRTGQWDAVLFLFAGINLAAALCWLPFDARGSIGQADAT